jgi:hypothetical protein
LTPRKSFTQFRFITQLRDKLSHRRFRDRAAASITRRDINDLLQTKAFGIDGNGGHGHASNRLKSLLSKMFKWALSH